MKARRARSTNWKDEAVEEALSECLSAQEDADFSLSVKEIVHRAILRVMAKEVDRLCGQKHHPGIDSEYKRAGTALGHYYFSNERIPLKHPRVRRQDQAGNRGEHHLRTYRDIKDPSSFLEVMRNIFLAGCSTRELARLNGTGGGKSTVSSQWRIAGKEMLRELRERDISKESWACLMLDGLHLGGEITAVVALGVTTDGRKMYLDFEAGASESAEVARGLLDRLDKRGFHPHEGCRLLSVLDGSEALKKAVKERYPDAALQRCLVHKERNVLAHLSHKHWPEARRLFTRLRHAEGEEAGWEALEELKSFLKKRSKLAYDGVLSCEEEMVAFHKLGVPSSLNISFLSTNFIENGFNNVRRKISRVKRWDQRSDQVSQWVAYGLLSAERGFKRISGHEDMHYLVEALRLPVGQTA